jgi:SAM-dependent methyltransferase
MVHQTTQATHYDRYPELFQQVSNLFYNKENKRILSFGCSYGDEVMALKDIYFRPSIIDGVDIENEVVLEAKKKAVRQANIIMDYNSFIRDEETKYDCIFAMSVFCRWEDTEYTDNCAKIYSFDEFEHGLRILDSKLKVDGVLVIYNSNFCLEHSSIGAKYRHIPHKEAESGFVHKFNKNNEKIYNDINKMYLYNYEKAIFRKVK